MKVKDQKDAGSKTTHDQDIMTNQQLLSTDDLDLNFCENSLRTAHYITDLYIQLSADREEQIHP